MKILLLLYLSAAASASPGPAGATAHQSYSRVYSTPHDPSHRISIVKSDRDGGEDAYVASDFYRRVRDKRRLANSRIGERGRGGGPDGVDGDCDGDGSCRAGVDHSLDHYFDHDITRPSHSRGEGATAPKASARGGSGPSPPSRPSSPRDDRGGHYANPRRVRGGGGSPSADADAAGHHRIHQASHVHSHRDDFVAEHHLGLLRVPCSIALNANEASLGHQLSNQVEGRVNVQGERRAVFRGRRGPLLFCRGCRFFAHHLLLASAFGLKLSFDSHDAGRRLRRHGCAGDHHLGVRGEAGGDLPPHRPTVCRTRDR